MKTMKRTLEGISGQEEREAAIQPDWVAGAARFVWTEVSQHYKEFLHLAFPHIYSDSNFSS